MLNILIVDDDPQFQASYRSLIERHGYTCRVAASRDEALAEWRAGQFDVVLLDLRLQGKSGPDDGMDLLQEARFSTAKVIVITGYADEPSIKRAFELGAYDYLEKGNLAPTLLAVKLDRVRELVRARQVPGERGEQVIRELWRTLREGTAQARGRRLEELILRILVSVPGFVEASKNLRTETDELDLVVRNESPDEFWRKLTPYLLAEAKNWSRPVGTPEVGWFGLKLQQRVADASTGFLFAPEGFSERVDTQVQLLRQQGVQVVPVDGEAMHALVHSADRSTLLKSLHHKAAVG